MTDIGPSPPAPRRSQREKKQVDRFVPENAKKRKRDDDTDDDSPEPRSDPEDQDVEEVEEDFQASKPKRKPSTTGSKRKSKATLKAPAPKRPRVAKAFNARKEPKSTTKKTRKAKGTETFDAEKVSKDTNISGDNPLFNALMNQSADLQNVVEDLLESLTQSPDATLAELINCILRACGCNNSIDSDQVADYDGIVDVLEDVTDALKKNDSLASVYPLVSKLSAFKKFRKSLSELFERLVVSSAELGKLYNTELMRTLQHWVTSMSSSQVRGFRHTATVIALEIETALAHVAAAVEKEAEVVGRQREGERKRKGSNKAKTGRDKELEAKAAAIRDRRTKLSEYLKDFVDGVFVHRYRDTDWAIRVECIRALGLWFQKHPGHFLDGAYLRYVGWVFSDDNMHVRLEAVKSLAGAYEQEDHISSLQTFTERFKPRMIQMATGDTETSVRVAVIQVLGAIDGHSLLEDDQRETLCLLVFDEDPRVRKAVSNFVQGVWEDAVQDRLVGRKASLLEKKRARVKALATLLVRWNASLDRLTIGGEEEDDDGNGEGTSQVKPLKEVVPVMDPQKKGRTALAVEVLWTEIDPISDWESLLDILLLDHSASAAEDEGDATQTSGRNGHQAADESIVDDAWRLEEVEEAMVLEIFVASIKKALTEAAGGKKGEEETVSSDITRALINGLPRLFVKHQTDDNRIADVLLIPPLMNLELYLEMRMMTSYETLWEDVTKQFMSHSSQTVLVHAVVAIQQFMNATSLSNTNNTKILELEDELSTSLRDAVGGRDELEIASFTEDEVSTLTHICARLAAFAKIRNMISWLEEDEGGKQSSAWDIVSALAERGRLGYKEEETMVSETLNLLTVHVIWKTKALPPSTDRSPEEQRLEESLMEQRNSVLEKLLEYAVGTQSNTVEGVRRAAFLNLMDLHILFCPSTTSGPDGKELEAAPVSLSLDDEVQYRCAGFVQAEIERFKEYLEELHPPPPEDDQGSEGSDGEGSETEVQTKKVKKGKGKKQKDKMADASNSPKTVAELQREHVFIRVMLTFLRAINTGAVHHRHGAIFLSHYNRLVEPFDLCAKTVVEILRHEGIFGNHAQIVGEVIIQALRESYTMVLDGVEHSKEPCIALAKLLSTCFLIRGAQLSVVGRLDSKVAVEVQMSLLSWIGKRLGVFESTGNKRMRNKAADFFKVLVPLLSTIDSRDALKIKAHMEHVLAQAKVKILPTSKIWDSQRAYEKKLSNVMSKDKAPGTKAKKTKGKGAKGAVDSASSDEGEAEAQESEIETTVAERQPARRSLRTRPKPTPKPKPKRRAPTESDSDTLTEILTEPEAEPPEVEDEIEEADADAEKPEAPATPRPLRTYGSRTTNGPSSEIPNGSFTFDTQPSVVNGSGSTSLSKKRLRSDDDDPDQIMEDLEEDDHPTAEPVDNLPSEHPAEDEVGDLIISRKRIRH